MGGTFYVFNSDTFERVYHSILCRARYIENPFVQTTHSIYSRDVEGQTTALIPSVNQTQVSTCQAPILVDIDHSSSSVGSAPGTTQWTFLDGHRPDLRADDAFVPRTCTCPTENVRVTPTYRVLDCPAVRSERGQNHTCVIRPKSDIKMKSRTQPCRSSLGPVPAAVEETPGFGPLSRWV